VNVETGEKKRGEEDNPRCGEDSQKPYFKRIQGKEENLFILGYPI
jgi:hypothetical protein